MPFVLPPWSGLSGGTAGVIGVSVLMRLEKDEAKTGEEMETEEEESGEG